MEVCTPPRLTVAQNHEKVEKSLKIKNSRNRVTPMFLESYNLCLQKSEHIFAQKYAL